MKNATFKNGDPIPQLGLGTWRSEPSEAYRAVKEALRIGYRHIDCAAIYGNEKEVGQALRDSFREGIVRREELFVTSKLWNSHHAPQDVEPAIRQTLSDLGLDYVDLYLIHWPRPLAFRDTYQEVNRETWKAFEYLLEKGYVRAIGVSNFLPVHMEALLKTAQVIPMVDQIEFHPGWMQPETAAFCKEHDILVEAWSPLGSGKLLEDPKLKEFGQKYGRSTAQICLRWCLQKGHLPLPKSVTPVRIKENLQLFDFQISQEDMAVIDKLECVGRTGSDPDNAKF
ncbi:aldo/keto reductase [uncultured Eubacterium sp.]|uniref:aldo/keto reductase n=1 Tax=uncultured Eubacterium sp. TaxID=165185 RepID=UPI002638412E|nr:aldo/keto reductase [uncultured Eubacterium sp.]